MDNMGDFYRKLYAYEQATNSLPSSWGKGYGKRHQEAQGQKGYGYFGKIKGDDGRDMTEYTIGMELEDGTEMDVPSIVPTLNAKELAQVKSGKVPRGSSTERKAYEHARKRMKEGRSIFATMGEVYDLPK